MATFIHTLLRSRALYYLGALLLTSMFWWSGLIKLWDFGAAQGEMAHFFWIVLDGSLDIYDTAADGHEKRIPTRQWSPAGTSTNG